MRRQNSNTDLGVGSGTTITPVRSAEPGTIAICFVTAALQSVRARDLNSDELLANVGLSSTLLQMPQARVSAKHYGALWRSIALAIDDEFFGQDSRRMKAGSFAMLCHSVLGCKNLGQALDRSLRFYALILDDISGALVRDAGEARIVLRERAAGANQRVFAHELLLMLLYGVSCWLVGRRIPILRTEFSYAEPAHSAEYRLMYSADLRFNRPNTAIAFEASYLDLPVVQNERSLKEFLRTAPESILVKYKNSSSLTARVRRRLRQYPPGELPHFEGLTAELNMTPATMRRRLHEEGASYQSIKDELRRDLAISYLSHSRRSVMDIALELGFSERSAFHRAFRKWTGASPGEFRRTLQT
jgi:AraC-like DNA-binding protein